MAHRVAQPLQLRESWEQRKTLQVFRLEPRKRFWEMTLWGSANWGWIIKKSPHKTSRKTVCRLNWGNILRKNLVAIDISNTWISHTVKFKKPTNRKITQQQLQNHYSQSTTTNTTKIRRVTMHLSVRLLPSQREEDFSLSVISKLKWEIDFSEARVWSSARG